MKSLRRDGYSSGKVEWAPTKTGREREVPLTLEVLETLRQHQWEMEHLGVYELYGLVFVTPTRHTNIYDHLVGLTWLPETEPVFMRASQPARLGEEKPP